MAQEVGGPAADLALGAGAAGHAAEDQQPDPVRARPHLALGSRADPGDVLGVEWHPLALDLQLAAPLRARKTSSWSSWQWSWVGIGVEGGGQVDHLHPERLDPELGARSFEAPEQGGVHLVDPLHHVFLPSRLPPA